MDDEYTIMLVYTVTDYTGAQSTHLAASKESAIQAHLVHYGLIGLQYTPKVDDGIPLSEVKRDLICWDTSCCFVGASEYKETIYEPTIH